MNKKSLNIRCLLGAVVMAGGLSACGHFPESDRPIVLNMEEQEAQSETPSAAPAAAAPAPARPAPVSVPSGSRIDEVKYLIQNRQVREMRTTYNGLYGASLLFRPDTLEYYAVLFENRNVWRVVKTDDVDKAEKAYRDYVAESARLAKPELDRIQLEAHYNKAETELMSKADELTSLQRDIEFQEQQDMLINSQQAQLRDQAEQLAQQQKEAQEQLSVLQRQIDILKRQVGARQ